MELQREALKKAEYSTNVAIVFAVISIIITCFFSILPEEKKVEIFRSIPGTSKNKASKQQTKIVNPDTLSIVKNKVLNKKPILKPKTIVTPVKPDTIKK